MNSPNPMPQLSPLGQPPQGKSNVRIAVITIVALHAVFFGGLLLQGCRPHSDALSGSAATGNTNTDLAPLTNAPYSDLSTNMTSAATQQVAALPAFPNSSNLAATAPAETALAPAPAPIPAASTSSSEYVVVLGDYPAKIAKDHGISVSALMKANPGLDPRKLHAKQKLIIPAAAPSTPSGAVTAPSTPAPVGGTTAASPGATVLEVKAGDTLTRIARQHGVTVKAIRSANNLKTDRIHVGQKLKIPSGKAAGTGDAAGASNPRQAAVGSLQ